MWSRSLAHDGGGVGVGRNYGRSGSISSGLYLFDFPNVALVLTCRAQEGGADEFDEPAEVPDISQQFTAEQLAMLEAQQSEYIKLIKYGGVVPQSLPQLTIPFIPSDQLFGSVAPGDIVSSGFTIQNLFDTPVSVDAAWGTLLYANVGGKDAIADRFPLHQYEKELKSYNEYTFMYQFRVHKSMRPGSYVLLTYANVTRDLSEMEVLAEDNVDKQTQATYTVRVTQTEFTISEPEVDLGTATFYVFVVGVITIGVYIVYKKNKEGAAGGIGDVTSGLAGKGDDDDAADADTILMAGTALETTRSKSSSRSASAKGSRSRSRSRSRKGN